MRKFLSIIISLVNSAALQVHAQEPAVWQKIFTQSGPVTIFDIKPAQDGGYRIQ